MTTETRKTPSIVDQSDKPEPLTTEKAREIAVLKIVSLGFRMPVEAPTSSDWELRGKCRKTDADSFHPNKSNRKIVKDIARVCFSCEVRPECLVTALLNEEKLGVWGGLTEVQRKDLFKIIDMRVSVMTAIDEA